MAQGYPDVSIQFVTPDDDGLSVKATVLLRQSEMVVEIPEQPSSGPYLVRSRELDHFFAGADSLEHKARAHVAARWGRCLVMYTVEAGLKKV